MVIIEGPDGSGKTTLAQSLSESLGMRVLHAGGPPKDAVELLKRVRAQKGSRGDILDRCGLISEFVYGTVLRGKPFLTKAQVLTYLNRDFSGWIIIYCRPSRGTLRRYYEEKIRVESEKKLHKDAGHVERVVDRWPNIVSEYDLLMDDIQNTGRRVLLYVRDQSFVSGK
jgi:adenylate kinase family enzyme